MYGIFYHTQPWDKNANPLYVNLLGTKDYELNKAIKKNNVEFSPSPISDGYVYYTKDDGYQIGFNKRLPMMPFKEEKIQEIINVLTAKYNLSEENVKNFQIFEAGRFCQIKVKDKLICIEDMDKDLGTIQLGFVPDTFDVVGTYFPLGDLSMDAYYQSLYNNSDLFKSIIDTFGKEEVLFIEYL